MNKPPSNNFEQSLFTAAAEGLTLARQRGISGKTGTQAIEAALQVRYDRIYSKLSYGNIMSSMLVRSHMQESEYIENLGKAVEMATELSANVDQQR